MLHCLHTTPARLEQLHEVVQNDQDRRAYADARRRQQQVVASSSGRGKRQRMHEMAIDQTRVTLTLQSTGWTPVYTRFWKKGDLGDAVKELEGRGVSHVTKNGVSIALRDGGGAIDVRLGIRVLGNAIANLPGVEKRGDKEIPYIKLLHVPLNRTDQ